MKLFRLRRQAVGYPLPMADQVIDAAANMTHLDRNLGAEISTVIGHAKQVDEYSAIGGLFTDLIEACDWYHEQGHESATADDSARDDAAEIRARIALIEKAVA